ncbi:hypothetical protein [Telluribacter humicola]|uniref:hypothetical protein n=1 Tax=Telluribacter humicola TaxID=1720261 RepID=UPI001A976D16|nr:hypothetical protein [Telluribacter humicola]
MKKELLFLPTLVCLCLLLWNSARAQENPQVLVGTTVRATATVQGTLVDSTFLPKTHWLIGTWKGMTNQGPFYETWRQQNDNSLRCYSIAIKGGDTTVKVNSRIVLREGTIVFEDPDVWKATRVTTNEMTFENLTDKGMRRIIWLNTKENHWWTLIQYPKSTFYYDLVSMPELDKAVNKLLPK